MRHFLHSIVWLAVVGLVVPQVQTVTASSGSGLSNPIADIVLTKDGLLQGQLVDRSGSPHAEAAIVVSNSDGVVVRSQTDAHGYFSAKIAAGGVYAVTSGQSGAMLRVWTARNAPPSAKSGILLISSEDLARGQRACCPPARPTCCPPVQPMCCPGDWARVRTVLAVVALGGIVTAVVLTATESDDAS
jgi:hypothetical protein